MSVRRSRANIPHYRQPNGSPLCGEACLKMIYGMYGIKKSIYDIRREITNIFGCFKGGSGNLTYELGLHLLRNGFDVEIRLWPSRNNFFACKSFQKMDQQEIKESLKFIFKSVKLSRTLACRSLIRFMEEGGKFVTKITTFRELRKRVKSGMIVALNMSYVNSELLPYMGNPFHGLVPVEFKGRKIHLLDPDCKDELILDKEEFLFMFYSVGSDVLFINGRKK